MCKWSFVWPGPHCHLTHSQEGGVQANCYLTHSQDTDAAIIKVPHLTDLTARSWVNLKTYCIVLQLLPEISLSLPRSSPTFVLSSRLQAFLFKLNQPDFPRFPSANHTVAVKLLIYSPVCCCELPFQCGSSHSPPATRPELTRSLLPLTFI